MHMCLITALTRQHEALNAGQFESRRKTDRRTGGAIQYVGGV